MKNQFVTPEIAFKLKGLGFNEECLAYYLGNGGFVALSQNKTYFLTEKNSNFTDEFDLNNCVIPLWQQVIDWLDFKGKIVSIKPVTTDGSVKYRYEISTKLIKPNEGAIIKEFGYDSYKTYYEAREKAILKALIELK